MIVNSAVLWNNNKAYFFYPQSYYRIDVASKNIDPGYPKDISSNWPGLWPDADAALPWKDKAYFFKGNRYVRVSMSTKTIDAGYPKFISDHWPGLWEAGIDAAVTWGNYGYFFKGSRYMRVDMVTKKVDNGYPAAISAHWPGLWTSDISGAVTWDNGKAYFFKGSQYMRVDMATKKVDGGYPKSTEHHWIKTPDDIPLTVRNVKFHCHNETSDGGSADEIYLVCASVDLGTFIPRVIARASKVMTNFDAGDEDNDWNLFQWGINDSGGQPGGEELDPANTILLYCLLENDGSSVDAVRASVQAVMTANAASYKNNGYTRDKIAGKLIADMNGAIALAILSGGLNSDERIPGTQELIFTGDQLLDARRGKVVQRAVDCYGDGGHYSIWFELRRTT